MRSNAALDRRRAQITRAFVDRKSIDWAALLERALNPADRAAYDTLRRLDALRRDPRPDQEREQSHPWTTVLWIMVALGATQVLLALVRFGAAVAAGAAPMDLVPHAALAGLFVAASLLIASAMRRDYRVFFLLATFMLTGSAFARPLLVAMEPIDSINSSLVVHGLYPDAFAPVALWQFVAVFPAVRRFTAFDLFARRAASTVGALGVGLFLANLLLAHDLLPQPMIAVLARDDPQSWFWQVFAWAIFPALVVIIIRAHRAPWNERVKAVRFAWAIGAGAGPILAVGVVETLPRVLSWMAATGIRPWVHLVVMLTLAAMPILATIGVLVDEPFERRHVARRRPIGWTGRAVERLAIRARVVRPRRHRERLSAALDRVRLARGSREIAAVLQQELQDVVGTGSVSIVQVGELPSGTALMPILQQSSVPIELSRSSELFALLPQHDREWLEASSVVLAAAVRLRDGTIPAVILMSRAPPGTDSFARSDRWFITTLLTGASAAWDAAGPSEHHDECADECHRCGRVRFPGSSACCADAETRLAALPKRLGDRFVVSRRLGAGGMGIVYLGRDSSLDRDVALKTWTGVREEMMARLCEEARLMATLNHDALATIYGLERWRRTPVLVMEYCARGTLAEAISRAPLSVNDVLRLGIRLTEGLTYMHGRGVFHRDIKPSNIGFTAGDVAKLLDFGLAGVDDHPGGTPAYLPPEVLKGAPPDAAGDLWGLAIVLREACAGGRIARRVLPTSAGGATTRSIPIEPGDARRFESPARTGGRHRVSSLGLGERHPSRRH